MVKIYIYILLMILANQYLTNSTHSVTPFETMGNAGRVLIIKQ